MLYAPPDVVYHVGHGGYRQAVDQLPPWFTRTPNDVLFAHIVAESGVPSPRYTRPVRFWSSVAAEADGYVESIDALEVGLASQRAGDHVAQGVRARLVGGDHAALDLLVHPRVIGGELGDLPRAEQVHAAVTDVTEVRAVAVHEDRRHRGGHPLVLALLLGGLQDLAVGVADGRLEAIAVVGDVLVEPEGPGDLLVPSGEAHELVDGVDGHLGGDLARGVAAHAVRHHEQVLLGIDEEAVLVALALAPDVGDGLVGDFHPAEGQE